MTYIPSPPTTKKAFWDDFKAQEEIVDRMVNNITQEEMTYRRTQEYRKEQEYAKSKKEDNTPKKESTYHSIAREAASLVVEKQQAYGDSFGNAQKVLEVLYPKGIRVDQLGDALTVTRIVDKLFRVANRKDAFGESPFLDILGYALLAVKRDEE